MNTVLWLKAITLSLHGQHFCISEGFHDEHTNFGDAAHGAADRSCRYYACRTVRARRACRREALSVQKGSDGPSGSRSLQRLYLGGWHSMAADKGDSRS